MDPLTIIGLALTAINGISQTVVSMQKGQVTPEQAHADLIAAHAAFLQALAGLMKTSAPPAPAT